jgi:hypothetical protein
LVSSSAQHRFRRLHSQTDAYLVFFAEGYLKKQGGHIVGLEPDFLLVNCGRR